MLQNYFPQSADSKFIWKGAKSHFLWDEYLDRQLEVLVLEQKFNFVTIANSLNRMMAQQGKHPTEEMDMEGEIPYEKDVNPRKLLRISPEICREQWTIFHHKRKQNILSHTNPQQVIEEASQRKYEKFNHLMNCLATGEDPRKSLSLDQLIDSLPPTRTNKDFLKVSKDELESVKVPGITGELVKPSGFNVLVNSIRATDDADLKRKKEKEDAFLKSLENLANEQEDDLFFQKPLFFKATINLDESIAIEKEVLTEEHKQKILSKKLNFSNLEVDEMRAVIPGVSHKDITYESELENKIEMGYGGSRISEDLFELPEIKFEKIDENNFEDVEKSLLSQNNQNQEAHIIPSNEVKIDPTSAIDILDQAKANMTATFVEKEDKETVIRIDKNDKSEPEVETPLKALLKEKINAIANSSVPSVVPQEEYPFKTVANKPKPDEIIDSEGSFDENELEEEDDFLSSQRMEIKKNFGEVDEVVTKGKKKRNKPRRARGNTDQAPSEKETSTNENKPGEPEESSAIQKLPEFLAGEAFRQSLLKEEIERKKREERERDLAELEKMNSKFEKEKQEKKRLKKEQKEKELEEQMRKISMLAKEEEQRRKEANRLLQEKLKEEDEKSKAIDRQKNAKSRLEELLQKLQTFETQFPGHNYYNEAFSHLSPLSSAPKEVLNKFNDMKVYNLSREGITSRYQILVFPYIDQSEYMSDFLSYFLHNSIFHSESLSSRVSQRHNFPFRLIGFFTGAFSDSLFEYHTEINYIAKYLMNFQYLAKELSKVDSLKKALFLIFDSYEGHGEKMLMDVLEIKLSDILPLSIFQKVQKYGIIIKEDSKLSDICLKCIKNMEGVNTLFGESTAIHSLSIKGFQDFASFDSGLESSFEGGVIIVRDVINTIFANIKQDAPSEITSTNMDVKSCISSEIDTVNRYDIFKRLLEMIEEKGLEILGIRSVHFSEESLSEYSSFFEKLKLSETRPSAIVIAVRGKDTLRKLEKIVGPSVTDQARKQKPKSLNALYAFEKEKTILYSHSKATAKRMVTYFFTAKLRKITPDFIPSLTETPLQFNIVNAPSKVPYVFPLVFSPVSRTLLIYSANFPAKCYGSIILACIKFGFEIEAVFTLNAAQNQKPSSELLDFIKKNRLDDFQFASEKSRNTVNLVLIIKGLEVIRPLKRYIYNKIFHHNSYYHPRKREILFATKNAADIDLLKRVLSEMPKLPDTFTRVDALRYHLAIWPMKTRGEAIIPSLSFGKDLQYLTSENMFEMIGLGSYNYSRNPFENSACRSTLERILLENFKISPNMRKRQEYKRFLSKLAELITTGDFIVAFLRLQHDWGDKTSKFLEENVYNKPTFVNSNKKLEENIIFSVASLEQTGSKGSAATVRSNFKNRDERDIYFNLLDILFLDVNVDAGITFLESLGIPYFDDMNLTSSLINDFPPSNFVGEEMTILTISQSAVKVLSLAGVFKRLESDEFIIEMCWESFLHPDLSEKISSHWMEFLENPGSDLNLSSQESTLICEKIESFHDLASETSFWHFILKRRNAVFEAKRLLLDLSYKLASFKNKDLPNNMIEVYRFQLSEGLFTSLSFKHASDELYLLSSGKLTLESVKLKQSQAQGREFLTIFMRIDKVISDGKFYELLQKMMIAKYGIITLSIISGGLEDGLRKLILRDFGPKFDEKLLQKALDKLSTEEGVKYLLIFLDKKNVISQINYLGSIKLNQFGGVHHIVEGSFFENNKEFIVFSEDNMKMQGLFQDIYLKNKD